MTQIEQPTYRDLRAFAQADSVDMQAAAATNLIKSKAIFAVLNSDEYRAGVDRLALAGEAGSRPSVRVKAIATLGRIRAVLKKKSGIVESAIQRSVETPLATAQLLENGDDRFYLASALSLARGDWVLAYATREAVKEQAAEKARLVLVKAIARTAGSVAGTCEAMAVAINELRSEIGKSGDVVGKRMKRIVGAIREVVRLSDIELGDQLIEKLRLLIGSAFNRESLPADLKVSRGLAEEFAGFINDLVRTHLSLAIESGIYGSLSVCRRWFPLDTWSAFTGRSGTMKALSQTVAEAIRLSARQGITDQELGDALEMILGNRDKALQITRSIADANPGLPQHVQSWLRQGRVVVTDASNTAERSTQLRADEYIATAMLEAADLETHLRIQPGPSSIEKLSASYQAVLIAIRNLSAARHLALVGTPGEIVEYSPNEHIVVSGSPSTRKVRIVRRGVERVDAAGNRYVLMKAIVEPVK